MCQENNNAPLTHPYNRMTEPFQEWKANTDLKNRSSNLEVVDIKIEEEEGKERLDHEISR
jgi:hypothetical protein